MKDIFTDMQAKIGCPYLSDLPYYKRTVWFEMKRLCLSDYPKKQLEDFSRYVFGVPYAVIQEALTRRINAREYGISEYVPYLLAIIQVESGGTAEDVMQSSESMGLPPNSLDTESSIKQGCKYFASLLSSAENQGIEDINVVVQSYNYGGGYIGYVAKNGKKHSFTLAENFARDKSGGTKVTYTNPIAVARNGGWRYG